MLAWKKDSVEELSNIYNSGEAVILLHYHGITVKQISGLRDDLRQSGAKLKVIKNTLAKIAAKSTGVEKISAKFSGPVAIAYGEDLVSIAKILSEFSGKNENLKLLGGVSESSALTQEDVGRIAKLPSKDELRSKIISSITSPARRIAMAINSSQNRIVRAIKFKNQ